VGQYDHGPDAGRGSWPRVFRAPQVFGLKMRAPPPTSGEVGDLKQSAKAAACVEPCANSTLLGATAGDHRRGASETSTWFQVSMGAIATPGNWRSFSFSATAASVEKSWIATDYARGGTEIGTGPAGEYVLRPCPRRRDGEIRSVAVGGENPKIVQSCARLNLDHRFASMRFWCRPAGLPEQMCF